MVGMNLKVLRKGKRGFEGDCDEGGRELAASRSAYKTMSYLWKSVFPQIRNGLLAVAWLRSLPPMVLQMACTLETNQSVNLKDCGVHRSSLTHTSLSSFANEQTSERQR
jgi:hypothetical protein